MSPKSCRRSRAALSERLDLDGELGPERSAALATHLSSCQSCREAEEGLRSLHLMLSSAPLPELSPGLRPAILARVAGARRALVLQRRLGLAAAGLIGASLIGLGWDSLGNLWVGLLASPAELSSWLPSFDLNLLLSSDLGVSELRALPAMTLGLFPIFLLLHIVAMRLPPERAVSVA